MFGELEDVTVIHDFIQEKNRRLIKKNKLKSIGIQCTNCGLVLIQNIYGVKISIAEYECINCGHTTNIGIRVGENI